ncbi:discoidin domain-containing protein [Micromonospora sp. NPDC049559]|uniref:discoidin domain-containing protein n=1 Tax=Micromonospora sp. NPDC049559 TaxID=3155923 RepID=UPI0034395D60
MTTARRWRAARIAATALICLAWSALHATQPAAARPGPVAAPQPAAESATTAARDPLSSRVHLFYYPWYGNPATYGSYRHWQQGEHNPPDDLGANLYPLLGAYDSGDLAGAVRQHMAWIRQSGAGVIVYSWWGQGSYEDQLAAGVLAEASREGIKVAWHLEPYQGRTAESTVADINYINSRYGASPAFFRDPEHGNRAAFYVFESLRITDWSALDQVSAGNIVLTQTTDTSKAAHFGGMYTYDGIAGATAPGWAGAGAYCKANGLVWAPSVAPGYLDDRAVPGNTTPTVDRAGGAAYDRQWNNALDPAIGGDPTWVSVTSFNEWHEGSVIEPASSTPPAGFGYQTFEGAYGRTGAAAETAYLDRTAYWVDRFTGANLAEDRPVSASSQARGHRAARANDGNPATYWESGNRRFPQWLQVDLGADTPVGRIVLKLPPARARGARTQTIAVLGSADGRTFQPLLPATGYTFHPANGNTVTVPVPAANARHLRLSFTDSTGWPAARLAEFEVYPA